MKIVKVETIATEQTEQTNGRSEGLVPLISSGSGETGARPSSSVASDRNEEI